MSQLRKRYLSENANIGSQQTFSLGRKLLLNDRVIDYSSLLPNAILYANKYFKISRRTLNCLNFDIVKLVGMITVFVWVMGNNIPMAAKCVR